MNLSNVPPELKELPQWVMRKAKVPHTIRGKFADPTDRKTWSTFDEVIECLNNGGGFDGIGFVFSQEDEFTGIDWDHVRNKETGEWEPGILEEIKSFNSYAEISPSGTGAHVICIAEVPKNGEKGNRKKEGDIGREMYDKGRYFTFTGDIIEGAPVAVRPAQKALNKLHREKIEPPQKEDVEPVRHTQTGLSDDEIIRRCRIARNSDKFESLWDGYYEGYPSHSEADQALCSILAFYTHDELQIDRLFSQSGLYREKWGKRRDYRYRTIRAAISLTQLYQPEQQTQKRQNASTWGSVGQDLGGQALKLFESVEKVTIIKGHIPTDPVMWDIQIDGKILSVDAEKLDRATTFRKQYLKTFNKSAPAFKEDWPKFVDALSELAEIITGKEESEHVYIANQIMEIIRKMPVTDDQGDAVTSRVLLQRDGYLCLLSSRMQDIAEQFHIGGHILSPTMAALGYKTEGTKAFRCNSVLCRFWQFYPEVIDNNKHLDVHTKGGYEVVV